MAAPCRASSHTLSGRSKEQAYCRLLLGTLVALQLHRHRLDFGVVLQGVFSEFAADAALFEAAEGQRRIHRAVDGDVGDVAGDVSVDAGDISTLAAFVSRLPTPQIPPIPTGLTITPAGPDPTMATLFPVRRRGASA